MLAIDEPAVSIKNIESAIVERAFKEGWVQPKVPSVRSGKKVAVVGSGPAGLACAQQLNSAGHLVTVFERADRVGGLLRYGIPDFKLEKWVIDRRLEQLAAEGISFRTGVEIGVDIRKKDLLKQFDAIVLCVGSAKPRQLEIPGADLDGVHYAMDFLSQQNRRVAGDSDSFRTDSWWFGDVREDILATDKHVLVVGGGDTGADCVGTSNRQGAKSITQFEYKPTPSGERADDQPWPFWPMRLRNGSSHEEGCNRQWSVLTKELIGESGKVKELVTVEVEWVGRGNGQRGEMIEVAGTETRWPADLVLLSMGFSGVEHRGVTADFGLELSRGQVIQSDDKHNCGEAKVFTCGDARIGQSLVVTAISEGREAARSIDAYLTGATSLPTKGEGDLPQIRY